MPLNNGVIIIIAILSIFIYCSFSDVCGQGSFHVLFLACYKLIIIVLLLYFLVVIFLTDILINKVFIKEFFFFFLFVFSI